MEFEIADLNKSDELEKKIMITCSFNHCKCSFRQGRILSIKNTNINFIGPHKVEINYKGKKIVLIYFDKNNLFFYNRTMPIDNKKLDAILKELKGNK